MDAANQALTSSDQPVQQCCRVLRAQLLQARAHLGEHDGPLHLHGARKQLKEARATLRLIRGALPTDVYKRENAAIRDAARPLSTARDAEVLVGALSELIEWFGAPALEFDVRALQERLQADRGHARSELSRGALASIRRDLTSVHDRSREWTLGSDDWSCVTAGLETTYRRGRRAYRKARRTLETERLHEWRKQVKYLWNELKVVHGVAPKSLPKALHRLSDLLGADHDLAVLRALVGERPEMDVHTQRALLAFLDFRRGDLQRKAMKLGKRVYREPPASWVERLQAAPREPPDRRGG